MIDSKNVTPVVKAAVSSNSKVKLVKGTKKLLPPPKCQPIYAPD